MRSFLQGNALLDALRSSSPELHERAMATIRSRSRRLQFAGPKTGDTAGEVLNLELDALIDAMKNSAPCLSTEKCRANCLRCDLRMSWGLAVIILMLFYSRGKKSSFQKIQFLTHAVRLPEGRDEVRGLLSGEYLSTEISVRVEPSVNRAIAFAHALELLQIEKRKSTAPCLTGLCALLPLVLRLIHLVG